MAEKYLNLANENIQMLLDTLANKSIDLELYRNHLHIGLSLGDAILAQIPNQKCSVDLRSHLHPQ